MKFYGREDELAVLEKACARSGAEMIVISGRRRVGKTRLVNEFLKGKDAASLLVVPKEEKLVAQDFAQALVEDGFTPTFNTVQEAIVYFLTKSPKRILYIDEFPNLLEVNPALPYEFQRAWEEHKDRSQKILIFSGSYARMMEKIFTRQKAPLFGRAGYTLVVPPLPLRVVWKLQSDLGIHDPVEKIRNYCVFGGIPFYYELMERQGARNPVHTLFFDVAAPLKEEGLNILRQEFGPSYKTYFSLLEGMGAGIVSSSELAQRIGSRATTLSKYLAALQNDFHLIERRVPFGENPSRSKKGVYGLKDHTIAFWFSLVYGKTQTPEAKAIDDFVSRRFELFCREFLAEYLRSEHVERTGSWWGVIRTTPQAGEAREIDIVVETRQHVYIGECKWTKGPAGLAELKRLQESAKGMKINKPIRWVLFSKNGTTLPEDGDVLVFDPARINREIARFGP